MNLKSDSFTGPVIVGILTIKGVSVLLGNDLAGGKVARDPFVWDNFNNNCDLKD